MSLSCLQRQRYWSVLHVLSIHSDLREDQRRRWTSHHSFSHFVPSLIDWGGGALQRLSTVGQGMETVPLESSCHSR